MKNTDFAMIILIASVSVGVAFGVVSAIPGLKQSDKPVHVKTIEKYTSDLATPDPNVFNKDAINPTVDVTIGDTTGAAQQSTDTSTNSNQDTSNSDPTNTDNNSTPGTDTSTDSNN